MFRMDGGGLGLDWTTLSFILTSNTSPPVFHVNVSGADSFYYRKTKTQKLSGVEVPKTLK